MKLTIEGETHNVEDWARATCTPAEIIHQRLALGVPPYEAVFGHISPDEESNEMLAAHREGVLDALDGRGDLSATYLAAEQNDLFVAYTGGRKVGRRMLIGQDLDIRFRR